MPLNPVKIPQNVYIEDRVVGPLTLKQTIIMTVGCGFSYGLYALLQKSMGGSPDLILSIMAWVPGVISVIFALIKVNDLSMLRIFLLLIEKANKTSKRTWAPRAGVSINIRFSAPKEEEKKAAVQEDNRTEKRIRELSSIIDRPIEALGQTPAAPDDLPLTEAPGIPGNTLDGIVQDSPAASPRNQNELRLPPANPQGSGPAKPGQGSTFSDLSVFKDIFSPDQKWQ